MEPWKNTPAWQELMQAYRSRDRYHFLTLITRLVTGSSGEERSFWVRTQNGFLMESCAESNEFGIAWDHLESVAQTASDDPITQETILQLALAMLRVSEDAARYRAVRASIRSLPPESRTSWRVLANRASVCMFRGHWRRARNLYVRTIAALAAEPEEVLNRNRGFFVHMFSRHAITCFATGLPDLAQASIREADALMTEARKAYVQPGALAEAKAELHLLRDEYQSARTVLQTARAWMDAKRVPVLPVDQVSMFMLVARISRAEKNLDGFRHFCDQALALCQQYRLPFSEQRVRALMAGAER